jgi:hypothetical protein
MGLFAVRCGFLRVRVGHATFAYLRATARGGVTLIPGWVALLLWMGLQAVYALVAMQSPGAGSAYGAHAAGFLFGLGGGILAGDMGAGRAERLLLRARRAFEEANWYAALGEYEAHGSRHGASPEGALGEARCHRLLGRPQPALAAYRRAVKLLAARGAWREAEEATVELARVDPLAVPEPADLLKVAEGLEADGDLVAAADLYERLGLVRGAGAVAARALERAADIARRDLGDLDRASRLLESAAVCLEEATAGGRGHVQERAEAMRRLAGECRAVLARRVGTAAAG